MRVVLSAGGTGGHIYPSLALAKEILKEIPDSRILFIGSKDRMEAELIPSAGYDYMGMDVEGYNGGKDNPRHKLRSLWKVGKARGEVKKKLKEFQPDVVVGFGNYISVPVVLAAKELRVPSMIHEQNSRAGMANRMLGKIADEVVICYPSCREDFPADKTKLLGNPRASEAARVEADPTQLARLGLDPAKETALVVMGSLGAAHVSAVMKDVLKILSGRPYQIVYVTGKAGYDAFLQGASFGDNVRVLPYAEQLCLMKACSLVVSRGGATSAAEIMAMGVPSVIIPSPYVPDRSQYGNAEQMVQAGCARIVEESTMSADSLAGTIDSLMRDPGQRERMKKAAGSLGFPDAAMNMVADMRKMAGERGK